MYSPQKGRQSFQEFVGSFGGQQQTPIRIQRGCEKRPEKGYRDKSSSRKYLADTPCPAPPLPRPAPTPDPGAFRISLSTLAVLLRHGRSPELQGLMSLFVPLESSINWDVSLARIVPLMV